eukprot:s28_g16.t1
MAKTSLDAGDALDSQLSYNSASAPLRAAGTDPMHQDDRSQVDPNAPTDQRASIQEAKKHVAEAARRLQEINLPLTHGFARLVLNRAIDELHHIVNRLCEALDAAKE